MFPDHRARYLPAFTRRGLEAIPDRGRALVVLPTGAIEQHGPHLPVAVDALMGQAWLGHALPRLPAEAPVYVAPPITVGKSNEHTGFPGTLIISRESLRELVSETAAQVFAWGFGGLAILNTHGGNTSVLHYTLREIRERHGRPATLLRFGTRLDIAEQEAVYGFHAGEVESSWVYAIAPELCAPEAATTEFPASLDAPGELRPESAPATFSWVTADLSASGVMGDARAASAEKGRRWLDACAAALAAELLRVLKTL